MNVSEHKTGVGGMAKLMIRKDLKKKRIIDYRDYIRPNFLKFDEIYIYSYIRMVRN